MPELRTPVAADASAAARPPKIPVSVLVVIHTTDGQVLLIERAQHAGYWQSVTGSLDAPDEPTAAAARREVAEETGITTGTLHDWQQHTVYEIYSTWRHRYAPGVTHNTEHWFSLALPAPVTPTLSPREHRDWRWLPWAEAAAACFSPSNRAAIEQLAAERAWPGAETLTAPPTTPPITPPTTPRSAG